MGKKEDEENEQDEDDKDEQDDDKDDDENVPSDEGGADSPVKGIDHLVSADHHGLQALGRGPPNLPAHVVIVRVLVVRPLALVVLVVTLHVAVVPVLVVVVGVVGEIFQTQLDDGGDVRGDLAAAL